MTTRTTKDYKRAVGVFKTQRELEQALYQLRDRNIDLHHVSVIAPNSDPVAKDAEVEVYTHSGGNHADTGAVSGALAGGTLGTLTGLLVGVGALAIPGIGPILLAGAEATTLATTLAGTAIGAASGGIIGALVGLGIPEDQAKVYNDRLAQGQYLILVTGTPTLIDQVGSILQDQGVEEWQVYDALQVEVTPAMMGNVLSPTTLERQETVTHQEVQPEVVYQERPHLLEPEPKIATPPRRVETKQPVQSERQVTRIKHQEIDPEPREVPPRSATNLNNADWQKVSDHPEVIVIDHRDEIDKKNH